MLQSGYLGRHAKVAVILNGNARGVQPSVLRRLGTLLPRQDLFLSNSLEHSRAIARTVLEREYDAVYFGGGDGTFVQCLDDLRSEAEELDAPLPQLGVLRLGTGNALADALGASSPTLRGFQRDLDRVSRKKGTRRLQLLTVDGKLTPFAGCGLDAQILEDYGAMGDTLDRLTGPLGPAVGAVSRYAAAVATRTVPRFVASEPVEVEAINTGSPAFAIDKKTGRVMEENPLPTGAVLFRGSASLASASTIPFYGLKLKMFPFAEAKQGRFQLRCCTVSASEILLNLPAIFRGEYGSPRVHDFLCDAVEFRMARPVPVQIGGDLQKEPRDKLDIRLAPQAVRVLA
jgi:diacylglycerol kinase family enzyme